jgi:hypothetical protein
MKDKRKANKETELLTFLKKNRAGEYCEIDVESLPQIDSEILSEDLSAENEESYYYSIR